MSKFITSSVNYSETHVLKAKYLSSILELYNHAILSESKKLLQNDQTYIIPNNNNKYYLFIMNKSDITPNGMNSKYKILYFFPDIHSFNTNDIVTKHFKSDFYVEIDNYKTTLNGINYLFEGYLYGYDKRHFLITDVLAIDSKIIQCDYSLRYALIHKLIGNQNLDNLNGHLNIGIHSVFDIDSRMQDVHIHTSQLFNMFKHNFIYKEEISCLDYINLTSLKKHKEILQENIKDEIKIITKSKYIDVYHVYNKITNNSEGLLYVKGLKESKLLQSMNFETIELQCSFNHTFKKWAPKFT